MKRPTKIQEIFLFNYGKIVERESMPTRMNVDDIFETCVVFIHGNEPFKHYFIPITTISRLYCFNELTKRASGVVSAFFY